MHLLLYRSLGGSRHFQHVNTEKCSGSQMDPSELSDGKKKHLFCTSQGLKLFICKSVCRDSSVCVCVCVCVCVWVCLLTGEREAVLITTNPHTLLTASERTGLIPVPLISLISCLLSRPFISLLFIYLHFVHTHSSREHILWAFKRGPSLNAEAEQLFQVSFGV